MTCSRSAPAHGGSWTSPATRCWCCPPPGCPAGCRSGRATPWAGRPNWAGRTASSSVTWCPRRTRAARESAHGGRPGRVRPVQPAGLPGRAEAGHRRGAGREDPGGGTVPGRAGRLADRPALAVRRGRARAVGAGRRRPDARAVRRGRGRHARRRRHRAAVAGRRVRGRAARFHRVPGAWIRRPSRRRSPPRSAAPRCSRPGSGSAPRGPCCCRGGRSASGSRCGSSGSGRASCSRWPRRTRRSRSSPRPSGNACPTCSTCPR